MSTDDHLNKWVLDIMLSELAHRQTDGILSVHDRRGHPTQHRVAAEDRPLAG